MSATADELEPEVEDVLQAEAPPLTAIPVCITDTKTPIRAQVLPHKGGSTRTRNVPATAGTQVLRADHFRGLATLMSIDQNMLVTFTKGLDPVGDAQYWTLWPKLVPFPITACVDVWVAAATATTNVSITTEDWAEAR